MARDWSLFGILKLTKSKILANFASNTFKKELDSFRQKIPLFPSATMVLNEYWYHMTTNHHPW